MNICTLPDLCQLTIFDRLSLEQLHQIGFLCHRWRSLQECAFKRRRVLTIQLVDSRLNASVGAFRDDKFVLSNLSNYTQQWLTQRLPNVAVLHLCSKLCYALYDAEKFVPLLRSPWRAKLVSLSLTWMDFNSDRIPTGPVQCLNALSSLRRLTLQCCNMSQADMYGLTVLSQVERFVYHLKDSKDTVQLCQMLTTQSALTGGLSRLKSIKIYHGLHFLMYDLENSAKQLLKLSPTIARKVVYLDFLGILPNSLLRKCCRHFSSLTTVSLSSNPNQMSLLSEHERIDYLAYLPKLRELYIYLCASLRSMQVNIAQLPSAPLSSVVSLELKISNHAVPNILSQLWPEQTFPNLANLTIRYAAHKQCNICMAHYDSSTEQQQRICVHHLIEPFVACSKLSTIQVFTDDLKRTVVRPFLLQNVGPNIRL